MYKKILLALDVSPADRPIIEHIKKLAGMMASHVVLLHVATGVAVQFHGEEAAGQEVEAGRAYLEQVRQEFETAAVSAGTRLAFGDPSREIVRWATEDGCDLIAMGTHGHKLLADLVLGSTASRVQHNIGVPVLLLRDH
jgi:nucleotide-binding universal stress UspA family protein